MPAASNSPRKPRRFFMGCVGIGCIGPIVLLLGLVIVFTLNNRPPNIVIPTPTPPANNAYNDFVRAGLMAKAISHQPPVSMMNPPEDRQGALAASTACARDAASILVVMRQGFGKPFLHPPLRSDSSDFSKEHGALRELARLISGVRDYYDLSGKPYLAVQAALDGEEMAAKLPRGGGSLAQMVGSACQSISMSYFEDLVPRLRAGELDTMSARLQRIAAMRVLYLDILLEDANTHAAEEQERLRNWSAKSVVGRYKDLGDLIDAEDDMRSMFGQKVETPAAIKTLKIAPFALSNKAAALRANFDYFHALATESGRPFTGKSGVLVPQNQYSSFFGMCGNEMRSSAVNTEVQLDLIRIEVALYRFKVRRGTFPVILAELQPQFIASVPMDGFGGKPFKYSARGRGFLLYSIGPDFVDNGGTPLRWPTSQEAGDIVAGHLSPKRSWRK